MPEGSGQCPHAVAAHAPTDPIAHAGGPPHSGDVGSDAGDARQVGERERARQRREQLVLAAGADEAQEVGVVLPVEQAESRP